MRVKKFQIPGPIFFSLDSYKDQRGEFFESFNQGNFSPYIKESFKQDNISYSRPNVIRGLHYQEKNAQGKLMYCLKGKILDVALDIRKDSETFGEHVSVVLDSTKREAFYVPPGFAHGFAVSKDEDAIILYKCTTLYNKGFDRGLSWNCIDVKMPEKFIDEDKIIMSEKDMEAEKDIKLINGVRV